MPYGNCLIGALVLMLNRNWKRLHIVKSRSGIPHFVVEMQDGRLWHYRVVKDVLCWPFYFVVFRGKFARYRKKN